MAEPVTSMGALDDWLRWAIGGLVGAIAWLVRQISGKAGKDELASVLERVDRHYAEAQQSRAKLHDRLDEAITAMNKTAVAVGRLEGTLGKKSVGE